MSKSCFATPRASRLAVAVAAAVIPWLPALAATPVVASAPAETAETAAPAAPAPARAVPTTLDRVEVRGQRRRIATVASIEQAAQRLGERAGGTALVDGERYRDGRVGTLADALGYAPGVFVQPRFGAEEARLSIRGSGLQRTFHGRGIALLQDGSPLNLADGGFDFQAIEPLATRYIAVYRGANALEYGAATLGGAIDFVSPSGYDAPALAARSEAGSFGYRRGQLAVAGHGARADGYLSLTGLGQAGFRAHAQQENYRLFGNAGLRIDDALDARLYYTHVDTRSELPGNLTLAAAMRDPRAAAAGSIALDQRRDFRLDRIAGKLAWTPAAGRALVLSAYYADKSLDHPIFQVLQQDSQDAGIDLRWRGEGRLGARRNVLVAGIGFAQGDTDDDRYLNVQGRKGARSNRFAQRAQNASAFVENQTWLDPHWVLAVGVQGLRSTRRSRDLLVSAGNCGQASCDESYRARYAGLSPKLGLRYVPDAGLQVFANLSRSLEPPSFGELSGGPQVTQVDKQRGDSAEIGLRLQRQALALDVALYRARIAGELLALNDGAGNPLGTVNAGRTVHQGLELGVGWRLGEAWLLSANYLYHDFSFDHDAVYGSNALAGVPPQQLRATLRWSPGERLYVAPNVEWAPQDYYVDHANTLKAPGYAIVGVRIGGRIATRWSWFADARNLADRKWIASTGVVADAGHRDQASFLPGEGRALFVGLEWRLQ